MRPITKIDSVREEIVLRPCEVRVYGENLEEAIRRFKTLVQSEGIIANWKMKQSYESPSAKKRRKHREAESRRFLAEMREQQIASGEFEKIQKRKEKKKQLKAEMRRKALGQ